MQHLLVAGLALVDLWAAVPPAVFMKLDPLLTGLAIGLGSSLGVTATILACSGFRGWVTRKLGREGYIGARTERFMVKYGTPGLGLLSPVILGPVLTCAGAIALGADSRQIALWGLFGVWLWASVIALALWLGYGTAIAAAAGS